MKKLFILAPLALAACVTPASVDQGIYAAYGSYAVALNAAADYAETPTADPIVVRKLNALNQSDSIQTAVTYGKAYVLCDGNAQAVAPDPDIDCSLFDFQESTAQAYAITLRSVAAKLLKRN